MNSRTFTSLSSWGKNLPKKAMTNSSHSTGPASSNLSDFYCLYQAWLFSQTPAALCSYREKELLYLRGNGIRKLEEWDRDYDYNVYNDFGDLDSIPLLARPVLGEFKEYPYLEGEEPETLAALCSYREDALLYMRETGTGKREEWDRVYDYDVYNNFRDVNNISLPARPVLEGYKTYPYPRRRRTERPPSKTRD
ncbi:hypothetical protein BC332_25752 [Capsicum chinense]|nr:hypothetical protein BC332_25752 [Capsicum chinense]